MLCYCFIAPEMYGNGSRNTLRYTGTSVTSISWADLNDNSQSNPAKLADSVIFARFNDDCRLDMTIVNNIDDDISVLLPKDGGVFQLPVRYKVGSNPSDVMSADFNHDHKLDIAVVNNLGGTISTRFGNVTGIFQRQRQYTGYSSGE